MTTVQVTNPDAFRKIAEIYYKRPLDFVRDQIRPSKGITWQQEEVLQALQDGYRFISVRSGHGIGKTALESWIIQWFMATRSNCRVPVTAPTTIQLFDVLWPEIKKWQDKSSVGKLFEWTSRRFAMKGKENTWFATARSSNKPENMQGFHEGNIMFVIEEASGVPEDIMEVVEGALTTAGAFCLMFGNPTSLEGTHYRSFHQDKEFWHTFTFNSEESPIVEKKYCERMANKFGKESDIYRVRVQGLHPREAVDAIFSISEVEAAIHRELPKTKSNEITLGIDVARFGDNQTVIARKHGNEIIIEGKFYKQDTMKTTGEIIKLIRKYESEGYDVTANIDDSGVGGGVTDRLNEIIEQEKEKIRAIINPVNNGENAFDKVHYANRGTECWMLLKEQINDLKLPNDEDLVGELTTRKKKLTSKGQVVLERKEDMKTRGNSSPDTADAVALCVAYHGGFSVLEGGEGVIF